MQTVTERPDTTTEQVIRAIDVAVRLVDLAEEGLYRDAAYAAFVLALDARAPHEVTYPLQAVKEHKFDDWDGPRTLLVLAREKMEEHQLRSGPVGASQVSTVDTRPRATISASAAAARELFESAMARVSPLVEAIEGADDIERAALAAAEAAEEQRAKLVRLETGGMEKHLFVHEAQLGAIAAAARRVADSGEVDADTISDLLILGGHNPARLLASEELDHG